MKKQKVNSMEKNKKSKKYNIRNIIISIIWIIIGACMFYMMFELYNKIKQLCKEAIKEYDSIYNE